MMIKTFLSAAGGIVFVDKRVLLQSKSTIYNVDDASSRITNKNTGFSHVHILKGSTKLIKQLFFNVRVF